eukprot:SRR837773.26226.p2 GENE.SRR837773.26226~~SRR837773.26226.p2  ORF type:complete len:219 (-),score=60.60 SRR837773.26226:29-595(-)
MNCADVALWECNGEMDADSVPMELLYVGIPKDLDQNQFGEALKSRIYDSLQEQRRGEFKKQLSRRQDASVRRRKDDSAPEGGDAGEERWREYLRRPAIEPRLRIHDYFEAGTRVRRVLGIRVSLATQACDELGKLCFRHIFEDDDDLDTGKKWYEDPFLGCFYSCFVIIGVVFVLWLCLLGSAIVKNR